VPTRPPPAVGAAAELQRLGAKKVFLVGGSFGGSAVLAAAPEVDPRPAGVISLSGEPQLLGAMQAAPKIEARLVVYPEDWHGCDLLYHGPYKARVNALVFNFLRGPLAVGCDCDRGRGKP